jgi:3-oxoacid CoA-transferase
MRHWLWMFFPVAAGWWHSAPDFVGSPCHRITRAALDGLLHDGITIAAGGFGLCGIPENLITALVDSGAKDLTIVGNNAGVDDFGMGLLLKTRQVKKVIASYVGENKEFERQVLAGELRDANSHPQGTLAEKHPCRRRRHSRLLHAHRLRHQTCRRQGTPASSAAKVRHGGPASRFPTSPSSRPGRATGEGNLVYRKTARNFNPMIATCGKFTVAEVEINWSKPASSTRRRLHTPGVFVDRIVQGTNYEKHIECRTTRPGDGA